MSVKHFPDPHQHINTTGPLIQLEKTCAQILFFYLCFWSISSHRHSIRCRKNEFCSTKTKSNCHPSDHAPPIRFTAHCRATPTHTFKHYHVVVSCYIVTASHSFMVFFYKAVMVILKGDQSPLFRGFTKLILLRKYIVAEMLRLASRKDLSFK